MKRCSGDGRRKAGDYGRRLWALLLCWPLAAAGLAPTDFDNSVELTLSGPGPWYRLALPLSVHLAAHHADLRDLRVFDADGQSMPFALERAGAARAQATEQATVAAFPLYDRSDAGTPAPDIKLRITQDGTLLEMDGRRRASPSDRRRGWVLDASRVEGTLNRLSLDWQSAGAHGEGFQRFSIEASDDLQQWHHVCEGRIVRLSANGNQIDQRDVALPGVRARYLRLLWREPREAPMVRSARVVGARMTVEEAPLAWSDPLQAVATKEGEYRLSLPVALPLERLRVELAEQNTLAPVEVASVFTDKKGREHWSVFASGILYRLPFDGEETLRDEIDLPGRGYRQLGLRVDDRGGGLGRGPLHVQVAMTTTQVIFLARGAGPYRLAFGAEDLPMADLPLATLMPGHDRRVERIGTAELSVRLPVAQRKPDAPAAVQGDIPDWKRYALWAVLIAGVAMVGMMAFRLLRETRPKSDTGAV